MRTKAQKLQAIEGSVGETATETELRFVDPFRWVVVAKGCTLHRADKIPSRITRHYGIEIYTAPFVVKRCLNKFQPFSVLCAIILKEFCKVS